ncbi:GumC family protein [Gynuella sp.]|uniref:GumC family protein n=1 Tax=Gynuella sp. TaxID=2969146 RepID=UPI003D0B7A46
MEELAQQPLNIQNYIAALRRYKWYVAIAIIIFTTISVAVALIIPPIYKSEGLVLVETQQIPDKLIQSTIEVSAAEQIEIIRQRVMTRDQLLEVGRHMPTLKAIEDRYGSSTLLKQIRDNLYVKPIRERSGRATVTIAFKLGFISENPALAQKVAENLINLFLKENVKARTERASQTTAFLEQEASKLKKRLDTTEQSIAKFKQANQDALPEHLQLYSSSLAREESTALDLKRQIESIKGEIEFLNLQQSDSGQNSPEQIRLAELKDQYKRLSIIYQPAHPDLIAIKDEIDYLEHGGTLSDSGSTSFEQSSQKALQEKINAKNEELKLVQEQLRTTNIRISSLEAKIIKIPQVERELISLNRDYDTINSQYSKLVSDTMQAQMAESLEQGSKAERFTLIDAPSIPTEAFAPNRKKVLAMGLVGSFGVPLGIILLIGFLDKSIRGTETLEATLGFPPLIAIPYIHTDAERQRTKRHNLFMIGGLVVIAALAAMTIHLTYMPLDLLLTKVVQRF